MVLLVLFHFLLNDNRMVKIKIWGLLPWVLNHSHSTWINTIANVQSILIIICIVKVFFLSVDLFIFSSNIINYIIMNTLIILNILIIYLIYIRIISNRHITDIRLWLDYTIIHNIHLIIWIILVAVSSNICLWVIIYIICIMRILIYWNRIYTSLYRIFILSYTFSRMWLLTIIFKYFPIHFFLPKSFSNHCW